MGPAVSVWSSRSGKPRPWSEKSLVWGGISLLLVLVAIEGLAVYGYNTTLSNIERRLGDEQVAATNVADLGQLGSRWCWRSGPENGLLELQWPSVFKR